MSTAEETIYSFRFSLLTLLNNTILRPDQENNISKLAILGKTWKELSMVLFYVQQTYAIFKQSTTKFKYKIVVIIFSHPTPLSMLNESQKFDVFPVS